MRRQLLSRMPLVALLVLLATPLSARAGVLSLGSPAPAAAPPQLVLTPPPEPDVARRVGLELAYGTGGYMAGIGLAAIVTFLIAGPDLGGGTATTVTLAVGSVLFVGLGGSALVLGVQQGSHEGGGNPQPEFLVLGALLGVLPGVALTVGGALAQSVEVASVGGGLLFLGPLVGTVIASEASNRASVEPLIAGSDRGLTVGARGRF